MTSMLPLSSFQEQRHCRDQYYKPSQWRPSFILLFKVICSVTNLIIKKTTTILLLSKIFPSPAGFNRLDAKMSSCVRNWKSEQHLNLTQYTLEFKLHGIWLISLNRDVLNANS